MPSSTLTMGRGFELQTSSPGVSVTGRTVTVDPPTNGQNVFNLTFTPASEVTFLSQSVTPTVVSGNLSVGSPVPLRSGQYVVTVTNNMQAGDPSGTVAFGMKVSATTDSGRTITRNLPDPTLIFNPPG